MTAKRVGRRLLMVLTLLAFLTGTAFWVFRYVGPRLVVDDALQPARATAALSGLIPYLTVNYIFGWTQRVDEPNGRRSSSWRGYRQSAANLARRLPAPFAVAYAPQKAAQGRQQPDRLTPVRITVLGQASGEPSAQSHFLDSLINRADNDEIRRYDKSPFHRHVPRDIHFRTGSFDGGISTS